MLVRDWMSAPAITASPLVAAVDVLQFMEEYGVGHVAVVEEGRLQGVLSSRTIRVILNRRSAGAGETTVEELMSSDPVTAAPDDSLHDIARRMLELDLECLPVVAEGQVAGMITQTQVLHALCDALGISAAEPSVRLSLCARGGSRPF
ncbi:MAG: CBS domain-containing protein [Planctomycetes bacterium]|nr:CBS domain-containing protein [Planctomycetota bacterium]